MAFRQTAPHNLALERTLVAAALLLAFIVLERPAGALGQAGELVPISMIQGSGQASPLVDRRVDTFGLITGLTPDGFYLQDPVGDGNPFTSDGIYVFTYQSPTTISRAVQIGACVVVRNALVQEYYGKTELNWVESVGSFGGCGTDTIVPIALPDLRLGDDPAARYERWEGMVVELSLVDGTVHGPTERYESGEAEIAYIPTYLQQAVAYGRILRPALTAHPSVDYPWPGNSLQYLSSILGGEIPNAGWGDRIHAANDSRTLRAVLDFNFGKYQLLPLPGEKVVTEPREHLQEMGAVPSMHGFTVCTYNVHGLGRGQAQYTTTQEYELALADAAHVIADSLQGCTIVALQETGTPSDASALAEELRDAYRIAYEVVAIPGPMSFDPEFPLTNSFLVRNERVQVLDAFTDQGCSNRDYEVAAIQGEECPPGEYPLFNRPPLVADLLISGDWGDAVSVRLINNHWKSKAGDEEVNDARRVLQAEHVAEIVATSRASGIEQIIVLGDLNDFENSEPLRKVTEGKSYADDALINAWDYLTVSDRYSFIFNGVSQVLDHILITADMVQSVSSVDVLHINADWPECGSGSTNSMCQTSDHDPIMIRLNPGGAAAVGGDFGFANIDVDVTYTDSGHTVASITGRDGGFRMWNMPTGKARVSYSSPNWLLFEDATTGESVQNLVEELDLDTGYSLLATPTVRLLPAMRAAEDASTLTDAVSAAK